MSGSISGSSSNVQTIESLRGDITLQLKKFPTNKFNKKIEVQAERSDGRARVCLYVKQGKNTPEQVQQKEGRKKILEEVISCIAKDTGGVRSVAERICKHILGSKHFNKIGKGAEPMSLSDFSRVGEAKKEGFKSAGFTGAVAVTNSESGSDVVTPGAGVPVEAPSQIRGDDAALATTDQPTIALSASVSQKAENENIDWRELLQAGPEEAKPAETKPSIEHHRNGILGRFLRLFGL